MEIFCEKCQKTVGQISDEKVPVGRKISVNCPICREKIYFARAAELSAASPTSDNSFSAESENTDKAGAEPDAGPAIQIDYDFSIQDVIREAWLKTSGVKGSIWGGVGLSFLAVMALSFLAGILAAIAGGGNGGAAISMAAKTTITVATYPMMAGLMMIAVYRAVDLPFDYKMVFGYFGYLLPIVISAVLTSILTTIGFLLLIIPGIYLSIGYLLVWPLVIDKGLGPWQAMEVSRKAIQRRWFKVFGLYLLTGMIVFISAIPMGLGLIWSIPLLLMVSGVLYRKIFGVPAQA